MKNYELMTIAKASLGDDKVKAISNEINELISSNGGKVDKTDSWGKRKFAYAIDANKEGYYEVILFELDPANISKLETKIKLMDGVIRYLISARK
jgi:small subunit ribosomal protein S6